DLAGKDRKFAAEQQEVRRKSEQLERRERELTAKAREFERQRGEATRTVEEIQESRGGLKEQATKLLRSEKALQDRIRTAEALGRDLSKRESDMNRREQDLEKREKATEAREFRLSHRSDAEAASVEDLKSREAALLREHQAKQAELERRAREVEGKERAFAKETASLQELKGKLEQQEMDLLVKIREFGRGGEPAARADATLPGEPAKLQKGAAAAAERAPGPARTPARRI